MGDASLITHDSRFVTLAENLGRSFAFRRVPESSVLTRRIADCVSNAQSRAQVAAGCRAVQTSASDLAAVLLAICCITRPYTG